MSFHQAFDTWITSRTLERPGLVVNARYISKRTERDYRQYYRALEKHFHGLSLGQIHSCDLHEYQRRRAFGDGPWVRAAGGNLIRKEVDMLTRMMRQLGTYTDDTKKREHMRVQYVESDIPRAMTPEEQDCFLSVAASSERWRMIFDYTVAGLQTTMSTNEMRALLIGDVSLHQRVVQVRRIGAKRKCRIRTIPLESDAVLLAFESLVWRAKRLGCSAPQHYLFPSAVSTVEWDPTRAMSDSGLKKKWNEVRNAAGLPWLRPYDLRHTGITRMAEAGTPIAVIMAFAGHMTLRMQQHYTAISMSMMRRHAASTWSVGAPPRMPAVPIRAANGAMRYMNDPLA